MISRVVIADDQDDVRSGFRMILNAQPDIRVVGEAADGIAAVELSRRERPDVVLTDIRMPGRDGLEVTRLLAGPDVRDPLPVVVVTTFDLDEYVHAALRAGACGFLRKRSGPALLVEGVRAAAEGNALISPAITVRLLDHFATRRPPAPVTEPRLTQREAEVLLLIARGRTNAEIAAELFITPGTAKTHVANLHRKLGLRNRVEIAAWASENGHVTPGS